MIVKLLVTDIIFLFFINLNPNNYSNEETITNYQLPVFFFAPV